MVKAKIRWQRVAASEELRRSSQTISIASGQLSIFGGELKPREPVANNVYTVPLSSIDGHAAPYAIAPSASSPPPRVGAASTTLNNASYLFSGRGGPSMSPLDEAGSLWSYADGSWTQLTPSDPSKPVPPPRSYHTMTTDGHDAVYVHAGCPASGRLNDLWAFIVSNRCWLRLADAPGSKGRGGSSIAFCPTAKTLYRHGGFDGEHEVGGTIDVYDPVNDHWTSRTFAPDGIEGPEPRSVSCLVPLQGGGRGWLVTAFGERDPSSLGHAGAGKMLGDVWAYDSGDGKWTKVEQVGDEVPQPRGWFAAHASGIDALVVQGGLAEDNSRIGDVWVGTFEVQ